MKEDQAEGPMLMQEAGDWRRVRLTTLLRKDIHKDVHGDTVFLESNERFVE
jgi:hypothetical protein